MTLIELKESLFTIWYGCGDGQYRICPLCRGVVTGYERIGHIYDHLKDAR